MLKLRSGVITLAKKTDNISFSTFGLRKGVSIQFLKDRIEIGGIISAEKDMPFFCKGVSILVRISAYKIRQTRSRNYKGIHLDVFKTESFIREVLESPEKGKFIVILVDVLVDHAVRFNKDDTLFNSIKDPEDKIRVESFVLIETNSFAATLVA